MDKELKITIRAVDQASPTFDRIEKRAKASASAFADVSDINPLKKIGKLAGAVGELGDVGGVRADAMRERIGAVQRYKAAVEEIGRIERLGTTTDRERIALGRQRVAVAEKLKAEQAEIGRLERQGVAGARLVRAAGAVAAFEIGGRLLSNAGKAAGDASKNIDKSGLDYASIGQGIAKALPGISSMYQGMEDTTKGVGDLIASIGEARGATDSWVRSWESTERAARRAEAAMERAAVQMKARAAVVEGVREVVQPLRQQADRTDDARTQVLRARDERSREIDAAQARVAGLPPELRRKLGADLAQARVDAQKVYVAEIGKVNEQEAQQQRDHQRYVGDLVLASEQDLAQRRVEMRAAVLRAAGKDLDAEAMETRAKFANEQADLRRQMDAAYKDPKLSGKEASDVGYALSDRLQASQQQQAQAEQALREKRAKQEETTAEKIAGLRLDGLRAEAEAGDKAAAQEVRRLEIAERRKARLSEIAELEKTATPEQKRELEGVRRGVDEQARRELARAEGPAVSVFRGADAQVGAVDQRFSAERYAQASNVEVIRSQYAAAKATADNTKRSAEVLQNLLEASRQTNQLLSGQQATGTRPVKVF
jgi:uncharacterized protein YaiI (UPF0178 family)